MPVALDTVNLIRRCAGSKPELQNGRSIAGALLPVDCVKRAQACYFKDGAIRVNDGRRPAFFGGSDKDKGFGKASPTGRLNYVHAVEPIWRERRELSMMELAAVEGVSKERPDGIVRFAMPDKASEKR